MRLGVVLLIVAFSRELVAQGAAPRQQVTLDAGLLSAALTYARTTSSGKNVGVGLGLGDELNVRLVRGEPWGRKSGEIAHVEVFERLETGSRWQYDLGVKAAVDFHSAEVASEATAGGFLGAYLAPTWGGRHFRLGARVQAGTFWSSARPLLGISGTPLTARIVF